MPPLRHSPRDRIHAVAVLMALIGVAGILVFFIVGSGVTAVLRAPGVVQSTEIKVAPEISGRLNRLAVVQGQNVRKGDDLAELANPELNAALVLAKAGAGEARAARDRVYAGIRAEQVAILAREIETDRSNLLFAEQQFARKSILAADGFTPRQDLDEATAAVGAARAKLAAAQETYQAAHLGPTREELAIADAKVKNADAQVEVIAARVAKLRLRAPADGVVAVVVAEPGEAIGICDLASGTGRRRPRSEYVPHPRRPDRADVGCAASGHVGFAKICRTQRAIRAVRYGRSPTRKR
jgi:HlyD family secretion protein